MGADSANRRARLRLAIIGFACVVAGACSSDDDPLPPSPPSLEMVTGRCRTVEPENSPAMYRCYGRVIRQEPLYNNEDRDLYAVLAAKADLLAERLQRRQITAVEARYLWETAKSDVRSETIRRAQPPQSPPQTPGP